MKDSIDNSLQQAQRPVVWCLSLSKAQFEKDRFDRLSDRNLGA